ncbi:hypothetical protein M422DRAFT_264115 [Sphaerobolus stellatus SS14]|uniref:Uncharacterized protein n=1 Tax=Sphaerobolus stellatus (strain SS14) TaxID=990650 RepID=A0A0C9V8Q6_SPHS4|nr:hypothetical protein M422DRAFT_264115 [Sphaerobolus stellatus SS14]
MSKVTSQLQRLDTTFVDFDSATSEEVSASFRPNTRVRLPSHSRLFPCINLSSADLDRNPHKSHPLSPPIAHITSLIQSLPAASRPLIAIDSTFLSPFHVSSPAAPIFAVLAVHSITKTPQRTLRRPHGRRHPPQRLHCPRKWQ